MILLFHKKTGRSVRWVVFASCLVVFGVLCERYVIVIPGLTNPPDLFQGMEIVGSVVEEGVAGYAVSLAEIIQALGVLGAIGFLFVWGLKTFKLLPTEAKALRPPRAAN
jgi:Ni/Fe-hydrogenase subunit HybB-like protein